MLFQINSLIIDRIKTEWIYTLQKPLPRPVENEFKKRILTKEDKAKLNFSNCQLTDEYVSYYVNESLQVTVFELSSICYSG